MAGEAVMCVHLARVTERRPRAAAVDDSSRSYTRLVVAVHARLVQYIADGVLMVRASCYCLFVSSLLLWYHV